MAGRLPFAQNPAPIAMIACAKAESQLTQRLFAQIIRRIERLVWHPT